VQQPHELNKDVPIVYAFEKSNCTALLIVIRSIDKHVKQDAEG
jgi:hypothetical protein